MARAYTLGLASLTLIGFGLRILLLDRFPLREDEAIYSVWAIQAWSDDFWLLRTWPDKPPLFLWILGGVFQLFGAGQASARWLNIALSTLTIPVVAAGVSFLWGRRAALFAAVTLAFSPFAVSFAPTVYTDPLLVLGGSLAIHNALTRHPFWAGLWLGAAIMTKQQGVLYAPLVVGIAYRGLQHLDVSGSYSVQGTAKTWRNSQRGLRMLAITLRFLGGLSLIIMPILYWDSRRWTVAPSPWDLSIRNYGTLTLLPADQWWARLQSWVGLAWHLTASWPIWGIFLLLAAVQLILSQRDRVTRKGSAPESTQPITNSKRWRRVFCHVIHSIQHPQAIFFFVFWTMLLFVAHIVTSVQVWDRYLLPVAPMLALTTGWLTSRWLTHAAPSIMVGALAIWFCVLVPPAMTAARGGLPIGGDHGAYTGLSEAMVWLRQEAHDDVVLYHRVLGWDFRFYLYDQVATGQYELRWFPNAVYLADNATKAPHKMRLLIEPDWALVPNLSSMLAMRGFDLHERRRFGHFTVLEIAPRALGFCLWCLCEPRQGWPALTSPGDASMMSHR